MPTNVIEGGGLPAALQGVTPTWLTRSSSGAVSFTKSAQTNSIYLGSTQPEIASNLQTALTNLGHPISSSTATSVVQYWFNQSNPNVFGQGGGIGAISLSQWGQVALLFASGAGVAPVDDILGGIDAYSGITGSSADIPSGSDESNIGGAANAGADSGTSSVGATADTGGADTTTGDSTGTDTTTEDNTGVSSGTSGVAAQAVGGLAGLLGLSGVSALIIRILEGIVAVAILFLGLQALTGQGSGNPVEVVTSSAKKAGSAAVAAAA